MADKGKKVIGLKGKKRSGSRLEFMEIVRKDHCFILQHHVFKSISSNFKMILCLQATTMGKLVEKLSRRFIQCLAHLTRADTRC